MRDSQDWNFLIIGKTRGRKKAHTIAAITLDNLTLI
jgi:hypothetical protein